MRKHSKTFTQPTLTQQHSKEEVDINNIMARYVKTGVIDHVNKFQGQYTENRETDFHTAQNIITRANNMFLELPSQVREKFNNDPGKFVEFVENPDNHEKLYEMGVASSKPKSPPSDKNATPPASHLVQPNEPESTPPAPAAAASDT